MYLQHTDVIIVGESK